MNITDISFPNMGIYLHNVPKSFSVFGFTIALYGVVIAIGMLAGTMLAARIAKKTGQDPDMYWDFVIYAIIVSVLCARLYYVIFRWDDYKNNLLSILNIRQGGLAIYGGVFGAFATVFVYSKIKKYSPRLLGDTAVPGLILGQAIGRWGNFFNREVFGEYTNNIFAMRLPIPSVRSWDITENLRSTIIEGTDYIQVHPTFLYESLWNLGVMVLLLLWRKHKKFDGELILLYLGGYGLGRAWIEAIRTDQLYIPNTHVPVSMVLAIVLVAFSIVTDIVARVVIAKRSKTTVNNITESSNPENKEVIENE